MSPETGVERIGCDGAESVWEGAASSEIEEGVEENCLGGSTCVACGSATSTVGRSEVGEETSVVGEAITGASTASVGPDGSGEFATGIGIGNSLSVGSILLVFRLGDAASDLNRMGGSFDKPSVFPSSALCINMS